MKAIGVAKYGPAENFEARDIAEASKPKGRQLLVEMKAMSVNPIDIKIRAGVYDDAPDYYSKITTDFQIIGPDGAGVVLEVGPDVKYFKPGDEVICLSPPVLQGSAQERHLVDERGAAHKPKSLDWVESAALGLTYGTAYESMVERMEMKKDEKAGILIINGAGGVGSMATQIARSVLNLPVVITTASRPETIEWCKKMGATHVLNHREDLKAQVDALKLDVPIKYIYILHSTAEYLQVCSEICAPLGKICSIVQASVDFYGTHFLSKSLTFVWCWLGTRTYHGIDLEWSHAVFEQMSAYCDQGLIKSPLTQRFKLTRDGLVKAHLAIESKKTIGKIGLGVDEEGPGEAFA